MKVPLVSKPKPRHSASFREPFIQAIIDHEDEALAERYLTVKPALDKNAILTALRNDPKQAEFFKTLGLEMVKEEKLTFEPDLEAAPASQTQAA